MRGKNKCSAYMLVAIYFSSPQFENKIIKKMDKNSDS